jgi:hypothetical protein
VDVDDATLEDRSGRDAALSEPHRPLLVELSDFARYLRNSAVPTRWLALARELLTHSCPEPGTPVATQDQPSA